MKELPITEFAELDLLPQDPWVRRMSDFSLTLPDKMLRKPKTTLFADTAFYKGQLLQFLYIHFSFYSINLNPYQAFALKL